MSVASLLGEGHRSSQRLIEQTRRFLLDLLHRLENTPHAGLAHFIELDPLAIGHGYILRTCIAVFDDTCVLFET